MNYLADLLGLPFWQGLVTTTVGVFGAASLALWNERRRDRRQQQSARRTLYRLVLSTIARDQTKLGKMRKQLEAGETPSIRLLPSIYVTALTTEGIDAFANPNDLWENMANVPHFVDQGVGPS